MESLLQDLRFGARILLRSPGITAAVIIALALGICANSAMFSVVDALLLHPLRYHDPATLTLIWEHDAQGVQWPASGANFIDWRAQTKSFSDIAGWTSATYVRTGIDRPEQMSGGAVTANFFRTLGVKPVLGRTFLPDEDGIDNPAAASKVAVISNRFWLENMGADPNVLGRSLRLNATSYTIIGVLLTESVLLSVAGGAFGLVLAWQLIVAAPKFVPPNAIPAAAPIQLSDSVILFTLAISMLTGLLFGLAPAMAATRPDVQGTLKDASRGSSAGRGRQRFRQVMVAAEVAVALMLLASAGLMIESLRKLTQGDLGFDPKNVLTLRLFLP